MKFRHVFLAVLLLPLRIAAQAPPAPSPDALRVYLDCSYYCDNNFIRTEINYLNWVRDQTDAQVHVIVSRQQTGGGGSQYTFTFTGRKDFLGREDTLRYTARTTDSEDVIRRGITHTLKIGLVPFLALTPSADRLRISWAAPSEANKAEAGAPKKDPWNFWVFTISSHSNFNGEESQKFGYYSGNISANRTTDAFKTRIGAYADYRESSFTYDPGSGTDTTVTSISKSYEFETLLVKSMGSHWSAGVQTEVESATFGNVTLGLSGGPAIEYSIWPYSEATRRSLTFRYSAGIRSYDYREITIYDKLKETHPAHEFTTELSLRQRFGSISVEGEFSQYLHKPSFYNASIYSEADIKLFKGFSINFFGRYEKVRDQLSLPGADLTPEEVLLQQRQRATGYSYFGGFGIRYSFGSIFNNVVNPRFGEGGG